MSDAPPGRFGLMPRLVIGLAISLIAAGALLYGVSGEVIERVWHQLLARPDEPMSFRFILQPSMAAIAAIHDGVRDEQAGRRFDVRTLAITSRHRATALRQALIATARIVFLGIVMDLIYQVLVLKTLYPAEAPIIAVLLGLVPYLVIRGPATIIARRWRGHASDGLR